MQSRYELVIYWSDEDQRFVVEVPELPGCMADGATYQEAVGNVEIIIEEWRKHYNTKRPHSALGYRPPAPESLIPMDQRLVMH